MGFTPSGGSGGSRSSAPILFVGVLAALAILIGLAVVLAMSGGDDETATDNTTAGTENPTDATADPLVGGTDDVGGGTESSVAEGTEGATAEGSTESPPASSAAPVETGEATTSEYGTCSVINDESVLLDFVGTESGLNTYDLSIIYLDADGNRVGDDFAYIDSLREGEHAIEEELTFNSGGASLCEIAGVDSFATTNVPEALSDISACEVTGAGFINDLEATVSATNSTGAEQNYRITVAVLDPDGARRGSGDGYVEHVRPDETAPTDIFTYVPYVEGYTCEVVAVDRYDPS